MAITLVFLFHSHFQGPRVFEPIFHPLLYIAERGAIGVDVFFVLSGFLITGILLKARGSSNYFSAFYARRTLRIFPLYYLMLLYVVLRGAYPFATQIWFWLNSSNLLTAFNPRVVPPLMHFWTLAIEEQFVSS